MQITPPTDSARVHIQPGFQWDAEDAYLFDIDGTMLRDPERTHVNTFAPSVRQVTGMEISLDGIPVHGGTDTGILHAACRQAGIPDEVLEAQLRAICDAMCARMARQRSQLKLRQMPGVKETLRHLAGRNALLGVATGNLEAIGWIKLESAGLREWFKFGGFSDHLPNRAELIGHAAQKARELAGANARICVVGDTPSDIAAARANSLPVIAVATGSFSFDELLADQPEVCASSLAALLQHSGIPPEQTAPQATTPARSAP